MLRQIIRGTAVLGGLLLGGPLMFGAINSCPTTTSTDTLNGFNTTIPGARPGNDLATLGAAGCTAIDVAFSNFAIGTPGASPLIAADTYAYITPMGTTYPDPTHPVTTIGFTTVRGSELVATDGDNNDGFNGNSSSSNSPNFYSHSGVNTEDLTYVVNLTSGGVYNFSFSLQGVLGTATTPKLQTVSGTSTICVGGTSLTIAGCGAGGGTISVLTLTNVADGDTTTTLALNGATHIVVDDSFTVDRSTGGYTSFIAMTNGFDQTTPEPSTFILLGTALCGLVLMRKRIRST